jgi:hypothetical protein
VTLHLIYAKPASLRVHRAIECTVTSGAPQ